uniref:Kinesin-like protein KIF20B n=1 Tax=Phallusia mammillata TaxID=59560 RepID=A0A6F9DGI5_9ASCI|nr:kinesin-like protein KIF20B [Phallusia mammillata]
MTAVPIPRTAPFCQGDDDDEDLFSVKDITKNLEKEFATPQVIVRHLSRLSSQAYVAGSSFMKVYLRVRPFTDIEIQQKENQKCMDISADHHEITLRAPKSSNMFKNSAHGVGETCHSFSFTNIFNPETGQKDFFDSTALPVVQDFISGQNSLIFTYGVTSSGKTHTIQGSPGNEGIMPRSVDVIFNSIGNEIIQDSDINLEHNNKVVLVNEEQKQRLLEEKLNLLLMADQIKENESIAKDSLEPSTDASVDVPSSAETSANESKSSRLSFLDFTKTVTDDSFVDLSDQGPVKFAVFVSFIEIYKDYIYDLLQPLPKGKNKKRPALRLAEDKSVPFVKGLHQIQVTTRDEVFKLLTVARNHLHMAETKLNHNSSRSHCIFTIKTVCTTDFQRSISARVSQISFCDLAGSERWGKTDSFGERLKEAGKINSSLMTLGKCIETLRHNQQHGKGQQRVVPYRESRLTRLFQGFLMGNGRACMIVNANQCASMFDETYHVLKFSAIASEVKMDKNPIRKSQRISRRSSRDNLSVSLNNALTRKASRTTMGWQPQENTITEEGSGQQQDEEETEDDESEEESDDEVTAFWREREEKLLWCVTKLKDALQQEKENVYIREAEVRKEVVDEMTKYYTEIEQRWEDRLEERVQIAENYGEKKYNRAVDQANDKIRDLVKKRDEAMQQAEELDEECQELDQKADALAEELEKLKSDSSEKILKLETELAELHEKTKTDQGGGDGLESRQSSVGGRESMIENLQQENADGREIIQEQLREMEDMRGIIERLETENDKLNKNYEEVTNKMKSMESNTEDMDERNRLTKNLEAELQETKEKLKQLHHEAETNKNTQEEIIKKNEVLETEKQKLLSNIKDLTQELSKAQNDLETASNNLKATTNDLEKQHSELDSNKQQLATEDLKLQKIQEDLATLAKEKDSLLCDLKKEQMEKSTVLLKLNNLEVDLSSTKAKLEKSVKDCGEANDKATKLELIAEENKEVVVVEMSELKIEVEQLTSKNSELTSTLEEAIACAEIKNSELLELNKRLEEEEKKHKEKEDRLEVDLARMERENVKNLKNAEKDHQKELLKVEAKLATEREELMLVRKDLDSANHLESQLIAEVDRLQASLKQATLEKADVTKKEEKRTSINVELERDIHILTSERDDLLKKTEELNKEISQMKSKLERLEQNQPNLTVAEASELETLRTKLTEMNQLQIEQQTLTDSYEKEKVEQQQKMAELQTKVDEAMDEKQDLQNCINEIEKERNEFSSQRSELVRNIKEKERDEVQLKNTVQELKEKLKDKSTSDREHSTLLNDKDRLIEELRDEVAKAHKSKEDDLQKFREGRDRIAAALDAKISSQNATNEMLKDKLDDQISTNVQLKSENSRLKAELQHEKKNKSAEKAKTQKKQAAEVSTSLIENRAAAAPLPIVKLEPLSPKAIPDSALVNKNLNEVEVSVQDMSTGMAGTPLRSPDQIKPEPVEEVEDLNEPPQAKRTTRGARRTTSRTAVVKKTSSRRKKVADRPSTPIPTDVFDDSRQSRGFPQPEMEMDVTPVLKKSTRGRKRPKTSKEEPSKLDMLTRSPAQLRSRLTKRFKTVDRVFVNNDKDTESLADESELGRQSRPRRRGKAASETNDDGDTTSLNKFKNISKMGDMLKNSPVGQALKKRFEAAISPSRSPSVISSPTHATNFSIQDQNRQSTRRVRKLHADDISLPLESTPTESDAIGAMGRGVGVLAQTQNAQEPGTRRLRRRKQ